MTIETPWGVAERSTTIAYGITFHSTPSHGGFELSYERMAEMPEAFKSRTFVPGGRWYEEDCDAAMVIVWFRKYFTRDQVDQALRFLEWSIQNLKSN